MSGSDYVRISSGKKKERIRNKWQESQREPNDLLELTTPFLIVSPKGDLLRETHCCLVIFFALPFFFLYLKKPSFGPCSFFFFFFFKYLVFFAIGKKKKKKKKKKYNMRSSLFYFFKLNLTHLFFIDGVINALTHSSTGLLSHSIIQKKKKKKKKTEDLTGITGGAVSLFFPPFFFFFFFISDSHLCSNDYLLTSSLRIKRPPILQSWA